MRKIPSLVAGSALMKTLFASLLVFDAAIWSYVLVQAAADQVYGQERFLDVDLESLAGCIHCHVGLIEAKCRIVWTTTAKHCPFVFAGSTQAAADFAFRTLAAQVRDAQRVAKATSLVGEKPVTGIVTQKRGLLAPKAAANHAGITNSLPTGKDICQPLRNL